MKVGKESVPVVVYTATHRIEGVYHAFGGGSRLLDDLNGRQKEFMPLTDVKLASLQNESSIVLESPFVAVNVHSIQVVCPDPRFVDGSGLRASAKATRAADSMGRFSHR